MRVSDLLIRAVDWFYIRPVASLVSRQTFRYAVCGGVNMLLDTFFYFLIYNFVVDKRFIDLGFWLLSPHIAAMMLVFPITFFNGFWLNRNVAFRSSPVRRRTQMFRYGLSIGGSVLLTYAGLKFFVEVCGVWPTPSKVITTVITVVYSYLAAKYFSFRDAARD